jgi:hypothetical protein
MEYRTAIGILARLFCLIALSSAFTACCCQTHAPPFPFLNSPADMSERVATETALQWSPSECADSYAVRLMVEGKGEWMEQRGISGTSFQVSLSTGEGYTWQVNASNASGKTSDWSPLWKFRTEQVPPCLDGDQDHDGISCEEEAELGTDPTRKTLFVRPVRVAPNGARSYWPDFIRLFPENGNTRPGLPPRPGFADVPPLTHEGIEVVVIGPPLDGLQHQYRPLDDFNYNPASGRPDRHCDILELVVKDQCGDASDCALQLHNGHTFFKSDYQTYVDGQLTYVAAWSWDTKGYTPNRREPHHYHSPKIYLFPLDNYFEEGAYQTLRVGKGPSQAQCACLAVGTNSCGARSCWCDPPAMSCDACSPMGDHSPPCEWPYNVRPSGTVEFNAFSFIRTGEIDRIGTREESGGVKYSKESVLRRTIAHELVHALLNAQMTDHCENRQCIMFAWTLDWDMKDLGTVGPDNKGCAHAEAIKNFGVVYNNIH